MANRNTQSQYAMNNMRRTKAIRMLQRYDECDQHGRTNTNANNNNNNKASSQRYRETSLVVNAGTSNVFNVRQDRRPVAIARHSNRTRCRTDSECERDGAMVYNCQAQGDISCSKSVSHTANLSGERKPSKCRKL